MENIMDNFLSIKEAVQRYSASCDGKIKTPFDKLFIKAMLAGMMIAMVRQAVVWRVMQSAM